jgi:tRNA(Met) C34 N-acetyltransferase TmcA
VGGREDGRTGARGRGKQLQVGAWAGHEEQHEQHNAYVLSRQTSSVSSASTRGEPDGGVAMV